MNDRLFRNMRGQECTTQTQSTVDTMSKAAKDVVTCLLGLPRDNTIITIVCMAATVLTSSQEANTESSEFKLFGP